MPSLEEVLDRRAQQLLHSKCKELNDCIKNKITELFPNISAKALSELLTSFTIIHWYEGRYDWEKCKELRADIRTKLNDEFTKSFDWLVDMLHERNNNE